MKLKNQIMKIDFLKGDGLVPVIIQDITTKNILMLGYMNKEAYEKTLESLYSEADEGDMLIEAHTIKGLAATIGATELHKDTEYFESQLREGNLEYSGFTKFSQSLKELNINLEKYFKDNPFKRIRKS